MAKIAISLPDEVLRDIEEVRRASGESRSQFFRRAAQALIRRQREREAVEQYIRGYQEHPETPEEVEGINAAGLESLAQEPWD